MSTIGTRRLMSTTGIYATVPKGYIWSEVGVIPQDWNCVHFGDAVDLLTGFPFSSSGYSAGGVRLVRGSNVKRGGLDWRDDLTKHWPSVTPSIARYGLREGDLVIAMDGALVGRSYAVIAGADLPSLLLQRVARVRSSNIHQGLLKCLVASDSFINHVDSVKTQTAIPHISPGDIRNFRIAIPPTLAEQRAIAEALSDVDGLLGALEALIAKKQAIKQAAMQQLLTGKTRLPGFSAAWETKRLGEVAELHRQNVIPMAFGDQLFTHFSLPAFDEGRVPVVERGRDIGSNKFRVPSDAVLVSKLNPRIPRVWMPNDGAPNAVASTEFLVLTPRKCLTSRSFLYAVCSSPEFCEQLELSATGTTGSHQRINPSDALRVVVHMPDDPEEQTAIATVLSDMDAEIAALEQRRDKTRAIKQGMMQQLLTGRVRLVATASAERGA